MGGYESINCLPSWDYTFFKTVTLSFVLKKSTWTHRNILLKHWLNEIKLNMFPRSLMILFPDIEIYPWRKCSS